MPPSWRRPISSECGFLYLLTNPFLPFAFSPEPVPLRNIVLSNPPVNKERCSFKPKQELIYFFLSAQRFGFAVFVNFGSPPSVSWMYLLVIKVERFLQLRKKLLQLIYLLSCNYVSRNTITKSNCKLNRKFQKTVCVKFYVYTFPVFSLNIFTNVFQNIYLFTLF